VSGPYSFHSGDQRIVARKSRVFIAGLTYEILRRTQQSGGNSPRRFQLVRFTPDSMQGLFDKANRFGLPLPVEMRITPLGEGLFSDDVKLPGLEFMDEYVLSNLAPQSPIRLIALAVRHVDGTLLGEMSPYPDGIPGHMKPGEYVIQVNPKSRRCGIGMLLLEVMDSYFPIDFRIQRYTTAGRALAARYLSTKA